MPSQEMILLHRTAVRVHRGKGSHPKGEKKGQGAQRVKPSGVQTVEEERTILAKKKNEKKGGGAFPDFGAIISRNYKGHLTKKRQSYNDKTALQRLWSKDPKNERTAQDVSVKTGNNHCPLKGHKGRGRDLNASYFLGGTVGKRRTPKKRFL